MEYGKIPYVEKAVSRIFYGTAMPPFSTEGEGNALLDAIFALGITAFDTARVYGEAEKALGKWMAERKGKAGGFCGVCGKSADGLY